MLCSNVWSHLTPENPGSGWETISVLVDTGMLGRGGNWPYPPVKLSVHNPGRERIDVDEVSFVSSDGEELVRNGDFDDGVDRWLFVTDQDLAWHIHQQWVETYFAQGVLGITGLLVLLIGVAALLLPAMWRGEPHATIFAAALTAFLTVGLLGSTMDTARMSMVLYFSMFATGFLVCGFGRGREAS